jgi:hypothetical protein
MYKKAIEERTDQKANDVGVSWMKLKEPAASQYTNETPGTVTHNVL